MAGLSQVELDALCTSDHSDDGSQPDEVSPRSSAEDVLRVKRARAYTSKPQATDDQKMAPNYSLECLPFVEEVSPKTVARAKGLSQEELDALCVDKDMDAMRAPGQAAGDASRKGLPTVNEDCAVESEQGPESSLSQADLDAICVVADLANGDALDDGGDDKLLILRKRTKSYDPEAYIKACQYVGNVPAQGQEESVDEEMHLRIRRARAFCGGDEAMALSRKYLGMEKQECADIATAGIHESSSSSAEAESSSKETTPKQGGDAIQIAIERIIPTPQRKRILRDRTAAK
jgi:hypothetical protein